MMLRTTFLLLALAATAGAQDLPSLHGTLRDRGDGEAVARVLVEVDGSGRRAWSDSTGGYRLAALEPGPRRVRFSRLGYETLEIEVLLPHRGEMRLDASLRARPVTLTGVRLETGREPWSLDDPGAGIPEIGARRFDPSDRHLGTASGEPDALWALGAAPDVALRPDLPTSLHVRGGSADQNLVLLDGIPLLGPHHSGGVLSALSPDAVAEVTLHAGVMPADLGGALSSVVDVRTREVPRQGFTSQGGVGMRGVRGSAAHALPAGRGGVLVAGRRSYQPGFPGGDESRAGGFGDVLGKLTVDFAGGALDVLAFASEDDLAFSAVPEGAAAGGGDLPESGTAPDDALQDATWNGYGWESHAAGAVWRRAWAPDVRSRVSAWTSGLATTVDWAAEDSPLRLLSSRGQVGVDVRLEAPLAGGAALGGASLEALEVEYEVLDLEGGPAAAEPSFLRLEEATAVVSAYVENAWSVGAWSLRAGIRGQAGPEVGVLPEPRLTASFIPLRRVVFSAGFARTHQLVQSLRNEESLLDAVSGVDLPVLAGMPDVPVGRADQLAAALTAAPSERTRLGLDAYVRWLDGLVLVAPTTGHPFALSRFETGRGRAAGATLFVEHRAPRVTARVAYAAGDVVRLNDDEEYRPAFERSHSLTASAKVLVDETTVVTAGLLTGTGAPTTPVTGAFNWEPFDGFAREGELEGSPQRTVGPLNAERVPAYARVDLGLGHEWRVPGLRDGAALSAHVEVLNVLDTRNVVGYAVNEDTGVRRPLTLLGRSLVFGLGWRY
ncbi:MAG TPA: carboxypeptidase regulatory-like domain-containing protein [Gemmatimonadota bacterium]|jgi:hypothetical protein